MANTHIRVSSIVHARLKEIAEREKKTIYEVSEEFLSQCIESYFADEILEVSNIEKIINNRLGKTEELISRSVERLAGLEARVGIDNSMALMGTIVLMEKLFKMDREVIQKDLRKQGAMYFSNAIKEDKEKKKDKK